MKRYAVIDIGTNSSRLLIADAENNKIIKKQKYLMSTRMGQGVDKNRIINNDAINRNIEALVEIKKISEKQSVEEYIVFGTSALRDAKNGYEFASLLKKTLGLSIDIIDGQMEAEYAFLGVGAQYNEENIIIMDIGGGSTEIVLGHKGKMMETNSINVGSVRMTEKFITSDPPKNEELKCIEDYLEDELQGISNHSTNDIKLIAIGGTATTISSINLNLDKYLPHKIHDSKVTINELNNIINDLISKNNEERKKIIGLNPQRSDVIIAGTIIAKKIMNFLDKKCFYVSDNDNLEGALFYHMKNKKRY
ncbi:MAG: Ppx/GppA family phosphatase [Eubacteriaceae bacterium]